MPEPRDISLLVSRGDGELQLDCELFASIAVTPEVVGRFDLMMSHHPEEDRPLTEVEDQAADHHWLLAPGTVSSGDEFSRAVELWSRHWAGWCPESARAHVQERWESLIPHIAPLAAAYVFTPAGAVQPTEGGEFQEVHRRVFAQVNEAGHRDPLSRVWPTWTSRFPVGGSLRATFERISGIDQSAKSRLGIADDYSGFLLRYAVALEAPVETLITARQFEHLVGELLSAENWQCRVTRYTKDDGVDVEATRVIEGISTLLLVQAKCHKPGNPVDLNHVKCLAATVSANGANRGLVVTTSTVTRNAKQWAASRGARVAHIDFVDGSDLRARLRRIGKQFRTGDVSTYFVQLKR